MNLLVYLLKVIVVSGIFYGYYRLFLRNKRFHHYNRFFLLSALLLSIVLPFIRIPLLYQPENPVNEAVYRTVSAINTDYGEDVVMAEAPVINESVFTLVNTIYLAYAIGVLFLLTLVIKSLLYISSLRKRYPSEQITSLRFYNTHEPGTPFSFFRSIFWNDQLPFNSHEGQQIFRHELFHVQHRHSADRLLSELLTAVFWFNPFFHLIKKELKAIHEFLADQFAISGNDRYAYATLLVQQALESGKHAVTNHFFQNHIKRRIAMITQFQKSNYGYWSRVMILPVSLLLFFAVTLYAKKPNAGTGPKTVAAVVEHTLAAPAGTINGAARQDIQDTIPEKEAKEKEMLKRQAELEEIRKKMHEEGEMLRKTQAVELEQLKKKMQEQELLSREQEDMRKRRAMELIQLKQELQSQQRQLQDERRNQLKNLESEMRQMEKNSTGKNDPKLDEARRKVEQMKEEFQKIHEAQTREIRARLADIESKSNQQQMMNKARHAELENLKEKLKERELEFKKKQQEMLEEYKRETLKEQKELNRRIQEKARDQKEQNRKIQEAQREKQEKLREEKEKKKGDEQSWVKPPDAHWAFRSEDSLLKNVVRHYLRSLRYPNPALKHSAEGYVYFSVVVDRNGSFRNFIAYRNKPKTDYIKDLVVVGNSSLAVAEERLENDQKKEIFTEEVKRATERAKPVMHPGERTYFFRAVFKLDRPTDVTFEYRNAIQYEKTEVVNVSHDWFSSHTVEQDTIPARKSEKRVTKERAKAVTKPEAKADAKASTKAEAKAEADAQVDDEAKPAVKAKPAKISPKKPTKERSSLFDKKKMEPRKPVLANKSKLFDKKESRLFKSPKKTLNKSKKPIKPKPVDGSGKVIDEQEESEESYSTITVTGEK